MSFPPLTGSFNLLEKKWQINEAMRETRLRSRGGDQALGVQSTDLLSTVPSVNLNKSMENLLCVEDGNGEFALSVFS